MKIFISGDCQTGQLLPVLRIMLAQGHEVAGDVYDPAQWTDAAMPAAAAAADMLITNIDPSRFRSHVAARKILQIPSLYFAGLHPDQTRIRSADMAGPRTIARDRDGVREIRQWFSAIGVWAFKHGMSPTQAAKLFDPEILRALGYFETFRQSTAALGERFAELNLDYAPVLNVIRSREVFMWGPTHPKVPMVAALCESIVARLGLKATAADLPFDQMVTDIMEREHAYGCYPPLAEFLGLKGTWATRIGQAVSLNLKSDLHQSFELLSGLSYEVRIMRGAAELAHMDAVLSRRA